MIKVLALICLSSVALTGASYQAYPWGHISHQVPAQVLPVPAAQCHTVWETIYTEQCATTYKQECKSVPTTQTKIEEEEVCKDITEKLCEEVSKNVTEKVCITSQETKCIDVDQTHYETTIKEECKDVATQVCTPAYTPIHSYGPHAPIAHQVPAYPHVARRSADAKAHGYAPQCTTITKKVCNNIPVHTPTVVKVPSCSVEPRTECSDVVKQIPETKCNDVTKKECEKVPKEVKMEVSVEQCSAIPQTSCQKIPQEINKQVCH